jgi:mono/diheme cytochrome c family protein
MKIRNSKLFVPVLILMTGLVFSSFIFTENKTSQSGKSGKEQPGKAVYKKYCLTCHQTNGSGVPGMFPPLSNGSWVGKNPNELVAIILNGLKGEIEVKGEPYKNTMPPQTKITNQELANVLTFVRSNFGNNFTPVTPDMVKKARAGM